MYHGKRKYPYRGSRKGGHKRQRHSGFPVRGGLSHSNRGGLSLVRPSSSQWTSPGNFPDQVRAKIRTYGSYGITSSSGAIFQEGIKLNSLYRPFTHITGDTIMPSFTNQFGGCQVSRVLAARVDFRFYAVTSSAAVPMWVGVSPEGPGGTLTSTPAGMMGSHRARFVVVPTYSGAATAPRYVLKSYMSVATQGGVTLTQVQGDNNWAAAYGGSPGDPTNVMYFNVICQSADASSTATIGMDIILTQYVQFERRVNGF